MPSLNKMSHTNGQPMPHTGKLIGEVLKERHVANAELARLLDVPPTAVSRYYEQHTIHAALLWKMGLVLEHNFFADLAAVFPVPSSAGSVREQALEKELADLRLQLAEAQKENETLMKVLGVLRS